MLMSKEEIVEDLGNGWFSVTQAPGAPIDPSRPYPLIIPDEVVEERLRARRERVGKTVEERKQDR